MLSGVAATFVPFRRRLQDSGFTYLLIHWHVASHLKRQRLKGTDIEGGIHASRQTDREISTERERERESTFESLRHDGKMASTVGSQLPAKVNVGRR